MIDAPRPRRRIEVFEVACWRCRRTIHLPASARPYRCVNCGALLVIEWRRPLPVLRRVRGVRPSSPGSGETPARTAYE